VVKRWRDCRSEAERRSAVEEALLAVDGCVKAAAPLLDMNRQYLHEVMAKMCIRVGRVARVGRVGPHDSVASDPPVGPTDLKSLTYGHPAHTLVAMSSAVPVTPNEEAQVTLALPKPMKDWLEKKALERKQRDGGRFAISPIVEELIEAAMAVDHEGGAR
jgi:hypothetical protein